MNHMRNGTKYKIASLIKSRHGMVVEYMEQQGLTQHQLAKKIGISISTFERILQCRWDPTKQSSFTKQTVEKICAFFKCREEAFFPTILLEEFKRNCELAELLQHDYGVHEEFDVSVMPSLHEVSGRQLSYTPPAFDGNGISFHQSDIDYLDEAIGHLASIEQDIIRMLFGINQTRVTVSKAADILGMDRNTAYRTRRWALEKLRKFIEEKKDRINIRGHLGKRKDVFPVLPLPDETG
ncbi:MAG: hypothetical protein FJ240_13640 [Nitrospira sp.]|nr:hypothetical protein [Nitrospira sp.]